MFARFPAAVLVQEACGFARGQTYVRRAVGSGGRNLELDQLGNLLPVFSYHTPWERPIALQYVINYGNRVQILCSPDKIKE